MLKKFLEHDDDLIKIEAAMVLFKWAFQNPEDMDMQRTLISTGAVDIVLDLLGLMTPNEIRLNALVALGNLAASISHCREYLLTKGLLGTCVGLLLQCHNK